MADRRLPSILGHMKILTSHLIVDGLLVFLHELQVNFYRVLKDSNTTSSCKFKIVNPQPSGKVRFKKNSKINRIDFGFQNAKDIKIVFLGGRRPTPGVFRLYWSHGHSRKQSSSGSEGRGSLRNFQMLVKDTVEECLFWRWNVGRCLPSWAFFLLVSQGSIGKMGITKTIPAFCTR